jgi:hypothetical protein
LTIRKVCFRQSGGFAGLVRSCIVAPDELAPRERRALDRLADEPSDATSSIPGARDVVMYELEVETESGMKRIEFDELSVPDDLASLVDSLARRARPGLTP